MSEPLSTTDIEDVLSSIRRLVAEDLRPFPKPASERTVVVAIPEAALPKNKLILTPALRVVTSDADAPVATDLTSVVASVGSNLSQSEWDAEVEDDTSLPTLDGTGDDPQAWAFAPDDQAVDDGVILTPEAQNADEYWEEVEQSELSVPTDDLVVKEHEAEPTFVSVRRADLVEVVPSWAQSEVVEPDDTLVDAVGAGEIAGETTSSELADTEPMTGTIEPDPEWADAAEADVLAELAMDANHQPAKGDLDGFEHLDGCVAANAEADFDGQEALYDEDLLREIVRDLLREELQGNMGERITRNIRKLVRAEIARALATQDLT